MFSDDGCNVTVDGSPIHERFGQASAPAPRFRSSLRAASKLPSLPGEPIDITVNYSNIIYNDDPDTSRLSLTWTAARCSSTVHYPRQSRSRRRTGTETIAFSLEKPGTPRPKTRLSGSGAIDRHRRIRRPPMAKATASATGQAADLEDGVIQDGARLGGFRAALAAIRGLLRTRSANGTFTVWDSKMEGGDRALQPIKVYKSDGQQAARTRTSQMTTAARARVERSGHGIPRRLAPLSTAIRRSFYPQDLWSGSRRSRRPATAALFEAASRRPRVSLSTTSPETRRNGDWRRAERLAGPE